MGKAYENGDFKIVSGMLYFVDNFAAASSDGGPHLRLVLPLALQDGFVQALHDSAIHPGVRRTHQLAAQRVWWNGMKKTIRRVIGACPTCLYNKETPYKGAQHIPENGTHPWQCWQWDIVHLHKTRSGMSKALVFYDRFSRDVEAFAVTDTCDTATVISIFVFEMVARHSWPSVIYSDRGSNLISNQAMQWFAAMGVETRPADAHMHTAVAGCERFNHTLREMARACHFDHGYEWDLMLPLIITWYKNLVQTSTGFSPFYMNHGRDPVLPWDLKHGPKFAVTQTDALVQQNFAAQHMAARSV